MKPSRAFTLIELLFVVAIIAVLAAIAVPNFLEAQIRSKLARTEADMAVVAGGLRAYYADYNCYPPNLPAVRPFLRACIGVGDVNSATVRTPAGVSVPWTTRKPPIRPGGRIHPAMEPPRGANMVGMNPVGPGPATPGMNAVPGASHPGGPVHRKGSATTATSPTRALSRSPGPTTGTVEASLPPAAHPPGTFPPGAYPGGAPAYPGAGMPPGFPPGLGGPWGYSRYPSGGYPILDDSGYALGALTTPVAYFTQALPKDVFSDLKTPYLYINYIDVLGEAHLVKDGGKERRYLLLSFGPDTDQDSPHFTNPLYGPFIVYDPTNGSVSAGDITRFGY